MAANAPSNETMSTAHTALRIAVAAVFLLAALLALRDWLRGRDRRRGYVAAALGCLGLVTLNGPLGPLVGHRPIELSVVIVLLMASAAGLLLYRNSIVRLPLWGAAVATLGILGAIAAAFASGLPAAHGPTLAGSTPLQRSAADALIAVWCLAVVEPAYRLIRVASGLPRVQRSRLRSLGTGYAVVAAILVIGVIAAESADDPRVSLGLEALALCCSPLFVAGFTPPRGWRRRWRQAEQEDLTRATRELLLVSPDRATLARRALEWAVRLLGGAGGLVAGIEPELLAVQGMTEEEARVLRSDPRLRGAAAPVRVGPRGRQAVARTLPFGAGEGLLAVVSGTLSPPFGRDDVEWLDAYSTALTLALDRVHVAELSARTEAELRSARDLAEEASRAKSEFLSRMSHELRTPLTAMIGFAELLLLEELSDTQRHHVRTILKAGDHLLALINDILDIARIEEGRLALAPEPVAVAAIVSEVLDLVRPMAAEREVAVDARGVGAELRVDDDGQRLTQVLLNLVSNAVKYNRRGGRAEISAERRGEAVRISVRDSGPGLSADEVGRLFSPFERLSAAASGIEGTGLGLALSKSLLEAMGGRIGVDSSPGHGSTFWVELPAGAAAGAGEPRASPRRRPRVRDGDGTAPRSALLLYAEDRASSLRLVEGIVARRQGLHLITAKGGAAALELARSRRPDLILLDAHLPDMDGADLVARLGADPATAGIPVVAISADATTRQAERMLAAGAREYLTKPIRMGTLLSALDRHLGPPAPPAGLPARASGVTWPPAASPPGQAGPR